MKPKIMDAVGLIGRYVADHWESMIDEIDIKDELLNEGFSTREISDAFRWIEKNTLGEEIPAQIEGVSPELPSASCRTLSSVESAKISFKAYGQLISFFNRGILDAILFEEIIERAMRSEKDEVSDREIRRILALTLFNRVQAEWREFLHSTNTLLH